MKFRDKLEKLSKKQIWDEYCSFLDLSMEDYMKIQFRLLKEQIDDYSQCFLGKRIMKNGVPHTINEFKENVPLTKYDDYQDILLEKREDALPKKPTTWLKTTWESGSRPEKWAPYTKEMLNVYSRNIISAMILSTSSRKGDFKVRSDAKVLYGLAPMPYATGLFPYLIEPEMDLQFMPSIKQARDMSFSTQNKEGFKQALKSGIDQFFGMTSVVYRITQNFDEMINSGSSDASAVFGMTPGMLCKIAKAKYIAKRDNKPIKPKDLFELDGFVCVGTDTALFKHDLEDAWGVRPLEIHGGTETACLATESWGKNGLVFFPDNAFYEFIPKDEMLRNEADPSYVPRTYFMDEVLPNEEYEIVITLFKGGAFMRYRPGDMYRCLRTKNETEGIDLPQFEYIDRVPSVIDIAGFTRFTEKSIASVLQLSNLPIGRWLAKKEYSEDKRSFMHMYVEVKSSAANSAFMSEQLILDCFSAYYRKYDHDYDDLKKLLGMDPTVVTVLPEGSISKYEEMRNCKLRTVNPTAADIINLMNSIGSTFGRREITLE